MDVAVVNCENYQIENVAKAVDEMFDALGGIQNVVKPNQKVFLKANLVRDMPPDKAATTHPAVIAAIAKKLREECGATVTVGDSCGGAFTRAYMTNVYHGTQMDVACQASGATLNDDFTYSNVSVNGKVVHKTDIINAFLNADAVINVAKLKTHSFTGYSGAVKNLFGIIPGLVKVEMHSKYPDLESFSDCLIDIEQFAKSKIVLHVIDGVVGMEGEGPTNGKPKKIGKLLAGKNPYWTDIAAVSLFANPFEMPLLKRAEQRGIVEKNYKEVCDFDFDALEQERIADFKKIDVLPNFFINGLPQFLRRFFRNNMTKKAKIVKNKCRGCGKCKQHCPAQAIEIKNGKAKIRQNVCIRCYCCQELCPFDAVKFKKPMVYRVVRSFSSSSSR